MLFPSLMHKLTSLIISSFAGVTLPKFYSVADMFLKIFQEFWYKACAKLFKLASSMYLYFTERKYFLFHLRGSFCSQDIPFFCNFSPFFSTVSRFKSSDEFGIPMTSWIS